MLASTILFTIFAFTGFSFFAFRLVHLALVSESNATGIVYITYEGQDGLAKKHHSLLMAMLISKLQSIFLGRISYVDEWKTENGITESRSLETYIGWKPFSIKNQWKAYRFVCISLMHIGFWLLFYSHQYTTKDYLSSFLGVAIVGNILWCIADLWRGTLRSMD